VSVLLPCLALSCVPPQTHLEESINRHKAHVQKLEIILRLMDNDELSPEQVTDIKDFVEDYVERNQVREENTVAVLYTGRIRERIL